MNQLTRPGSDDRRSDESARAVGEDFDEAAELLDGAGAVEHGYCRASYANNAQLLPSLTLRSSDGGDLG